VQFENNLNQQHSDDFQTLLDLRQICTKQNEQIKMLKRDINNYKFDIENLRNNVEILLKQNRILLQKNGSLQKQGKLLLLERRDLLQNLKLLEEKNLQLQKLNSINLHRASTSKLREDEEKETQFTLKELRDVLDEKNCFKARIIELEERLDSLEAAPSETLHVLETVPSEASDVGEDSREELPTSTETPSTEYCVYGPIDREPEEKLRPWKHQRKDSGVRRFFRFFNLKDVSGALT